MVLITIVQLKNNWLFPKVIMYLSILFKSQFVWLYFDITDSGLFFHLYGKLFDMTNILRTYELKSIQDFNRILISFENLKVCNHSANNNEFQKVKTTFSPDKCIESFGSFCHAYCTKIASNKIRLVYLVVWCFKWFRK